MMYTNHAFTDTIAPYSWSLLRQFCATLCWSLLMQLFQVPNSKTTELISFHLKGNQWTPWLICHHKWGQKCIRVQDKHSSLWTFKKLSLKYLKVFNLVCEIQKLIWRIYCVNCHFRSKFYRFIANKNELWLWSIAFIH